MTGNDDKVQMITKLLEKGGTMLANHHDCGAPMFRYQGKVVCPVCDFSERKQEQQHQQKQQPEELEKQRKKNEEQISNIIANKIRNLTTSLETETELGRIKDNMECIEHGVRILKLLREMD